MSGSNSCFLTCTPVSQEAGKVVWYSYLFKNFPLIAQLVKNPPAMQKIPVRFLGWENPLEKGQSTLVFLGFPCDSTGKESACNVGDLGLIPGLGRCPGEGKGYPLQYSGLEIPMDCIAKSWTERLSLHFHIP